MAFYCQRLEKENTTFQNISDITIYIMEKITNVKVSMDVVI